MRIFKKVDCVIRAPHCIWFFFFLEISAASDEEQQAYLAKLSTLSVDLTQYLTNLQQTAPDEEINVSNISNETKAFSPPPNPPKFQTVTNF